MLVLQTTNVSKSENGTPKYVCRGCIDKVIFYSDLADSVIQPYLLESGYTAQEMQRAERV